MLKKANIGPIAFNIFMNDLFYVIKKANVYNYADDNSIPFTHKSDDVLKSTLQDEVNIAIGWFKETISRLIHLFSGISL